MKNKVLGIVAVIILIGVVSFYNISDIFAEDVQVIKDYTCRSGGTLQGSKCVKLISLSTSCVRGQKIGDNCYDVKEKQKVNYLINYNFVFF